MSVLEASYETIQAFEDSENYTLFFYYKPTDAALVEEFSTFISEHKDDPNVAKSVVYRVEYDPEDSSSLAYRLAKFMEVKPAEDKSFEFNLYATKPSKCKTFSRSVDNGFDQKALLEWIEAVHNGTAYYKIKSEAREVNDDYPEKKGLKKIVANGFEDVVLNVDRDVFVDVYADWCGPCRRIAPYIEKIAEVLADEDKIVIGKINSEFNDVDEKYFPEPGIPNIKLFRAGVDLKSTPLKYEGERTSAAMLKWLHENCTNKFDLDKLLPECEQFDAFHSLKLSSKALIEKTKKDLEYKEKCDSSIVSHVEYLIDALESSLDETFEKAERANTVLSTYDGLKTLHDIAEKERLGNVIKIHSTEEFDKELACDKLVVVDFFADWCGPCQYIAPIFRDLSFQHTDVKFLKVDVDSCSDISQRCGICCMPTFQFFKNGEKVENMEGADEETLKSNIIKHK